MKAAPPFDMDLEQLLAPHPEPVREAFVAYLYLLIGEPFEMDEAQKRRLEAFARRVGLADQMSIEERQRRVDEYFVEHPVPPELLAALSEAGESIAAETSDSLRAAAVQLTGSSRIALPPSRAKGAPPGGHLNLLIARSFQPKTD